MSVKPAQILQLLQLASPALPVGAYSYSEGLEYLVQTGTIASAIDLEHWLTQELQYGFVRLETAIVARGYRASVLADSKTVQAWNDWLSAARETEELRLQSWQMGRSLLRLVLDLYPELKTPLTATLLGQQCNFAIALALIAAHCQIDLEWAILGYLHSWATNLVSAGVKLIPLGQTAGQKLLLNLQPLLAQAAEEILTLPDEQLVSCGWGLSLASMAHETQYSRLFRS